jgi:hypothetical protein
MRKRGARIAAVMILSALAAPLTAATAPATTIGSNLVSSPNAGICQTEGNALEASCTYTQVLWAPGHIAGGTFAESRGVITRWQVASGVATPATAAVKLRPRVLAISPISGIGIPPGGYVELPLDQPGVHGFPTRLPIAAGQQVALDLVVISRGGTASAPLAHQEAKVGRVVMWAPILGEGEGPDPSALADDTELLLNAVLEPDRDRDGHGDRTQDRCPEDPRRQEDCDRRPPRTHLTYAERQDFLRTKKVVVRLRSSEAARVFAYGQIDIAGDRNVVWGIYSARKRVAKGGKATLVLRVPAKAREAAARSFSHGRRVVAKFSVFATDTAGNESGTTVATIRPKR